MNNYEKYMQRCLELAAKGLGEVAPNPMVGCVIVRDGEVISEGYHRVFGGPHAEPNAISGVSDDLLQGAELYVNLEPCSHYGKTPPCADLIISKGIKKVVIGNLDPNPLVAGKGIAKLESAGILVEHGILEQECTELNKRFLTFHTKKRPYIILKWAQTADKYISRWPLPQSRDDNWITGAESKQLVHTWRAQEQAILIGYNTAINDDPLLTTRLAEGKNPLRMVLSRKADLPTDLNVLNNDARTILFNNERDEDKAFIKLVKINPADKVKDVLNYCYQHQIASIIVEGGTNTIYQFMNQNLWDEARIFVNPDKFFMNGIAAPEFDLEQTRPLKIGNDKLYMIKNPRL